MFFECSLLFATVINAVVCWYSYYNKLLLLKTFSKPPVCLILTVFTYEVLGLEYSPFLLGLILSALGDTLLLSRNKVVFLTGSLSFLLAHVSYSYGFSQHLSLSNEISPLCYLTIVAPLLVTLALTFAQDKKMRLSNGFFTLIYMSFISTGLFNCSRTIGDANWSLPAALLCFIGYAIFFVSDVLVCFAVMIYENKLISMTVITTYHIAQIAIVLGLVLNKHYDSLFPLLH
ncbi:hypothetical protein EIN_405220 [Entamoeba invadens IP1]|uniref:Transmembrane protein 86A n=2 Tax=Entamoeba invadens TaxID=33085 RepID=A0A0A1U6R3_ENTIV|nr:hypothetical protein EIN_405220 [Entamoeba invadens IP1]ELP90108.1 hypothetical protein EIN_405220 [Entamoeba invadens IP1]BAN42217.1 hypothetical protein [Entamoeba invadens]|eukprot:XP_004256879.1 hypothetical protein EIN_405220 [Entamoeba invadens IP1]